MPDRYQRLFPYMQRENWLLNYSHLEGIQRSLTGMSKRIKNNPGIEHAAWDLRQHYDAVEDDFSRYFPELISHISAKFPS